MVVANAPETGRGNKKNLVKSQLKAGPRKKMGKRIRRLSLHKETGG